MTTRSIIHTAASLAIILSASSCICLSGVQAFKLLGVLPMSSRRRCNNHRPPTGASPSHTSSSPSLPLYHASSSLSIISYQQQFRRRRKAIHNVLLYMTENEMVTIEEISNQSLDTSSSKTTQHPHEKTVKNKSSSTIINNKRLGKNEILFQKRLTQLQSYIKQHGHGSIPYPYKSNPSLGIWANNLRRQYTIKQQCTARSIPYKGYLSTERIDTLTEAGFDFKSLTERTFQLRLKDLKKFKERYGHVNVPEVYVENKELGYWVTNLRSLYRRRYDENYKQPQQQQQQKEEEEIQLQEVNDTTTKDKGQERGKSSKSISKRKRKGSSKRRASVPRFSHLSPERIQLLNDIGFVWSSFDNKWYIMLEWAKVYGIVNYIMSNDTNSGVSHMLNELPHEIDNNMNVESNTTKQEQYHNNNNNNNVNNVTNNDHQLFNYTLLLDKYHHFVCNIQNQSILSTFHPQDQILSLLLDDETYEFQPTMLDYRVPTNDTFHYPLRVWMTNQRTYNHLTTVQDYNTTATANNSSSFSSITTSSSITTPSRTKRIQSLQSISFPVSARFPNRHAEIQYEQDQLAEIQRKQEKERRIEQKKRKERERVEQLTRRNLSGSEEENVLRNVDVMALWEAGDDDEDEDW